MSGPKGQTGLWIPMEIHADHRLSHTGKFLMADIFTLSGEGRTYFKSDDAIAAMLGVTTRSAQRVLEALEGMGAIVRDTQREGKKVVSRTIWIPPKWWESRGDNDENVRKDNDENVGKFTTKTSEIDNSLDLSLENTELQHIPITGVSGPKQQQNDDHDLWDAKPWDSYANEVFTLANWRKNERVGAILDHYCEWAYEATSGSKCSEVIADQLIRPRWDRGMRTWQYGDLANSMSNYLAAIRDQY